MATQPKTWWRSGHEGMTTKADIRRGGASQKEEGEELSRQMTTPPIDDGGGNNSRRRTTLNNIELQYNEVSQQVHQDGVVEAPGCSIITTDNATTTTLPRSCSYNTGKTHCLTHNCGTKSTRVTSKKWDYIKSRKCYGWVTRKVLKVMCLGVRGENTTKLDDRKSGFLESSKSSDLGVKREVGRNSDIIDSDSSRTFYFGEFGDAESDVK